MNRRWNRWSVIFRFRMIGRSARTSSSPLRKWCYREKISAKYLFINICLINSFLMIISCNRSLVRSFACSLSFVHWLLWMICDDTIRFGIHWISFRFSNFFFFSRYSSSIEREKKRNHLHSEAGVAQFYCETIFRDFVGYKLAFAKIITIIVVIIDTCINKHWNMDCLFR